MDSSCVGCSMVYCRSLVSPLMCWRNSLACCSFIVSKSVVHEVSLMFGGLAGGF